jgi:hypothetical protein
MEAATLASNEHISKRQRMLSHAREPATTYLKELISIAEQFVTLVSKKAKDANNTEEACVDSMARCMMTLLEARKRVQSYVRGIHVSHACKQCER